MEVYLVGNSMVDFDSLPIRLMEDLSSQHKDINFMEFDPTEDLETEEDPVVFVDTVEGIKEVLIFENLDKFLLQKPYSLHDFDLGWELKLLQKVNKLNDVIIIGVPPNYDKEKAMKEIGEAITSLPN